jgi:hypothetical protein
MNGLLALSTQDTVVFLLERGFWPTVLYPIGHVLSGIPSNGKKPIGKNWGRARLTDKDIRKHFERFPNAGVGICLGRDMGPGTRWLIDIEVDDRETGDPSLASLFGGEIVSTMGWTSERGDHRLLCVDQARIQKIFRSRDVGSKFVELPGLEIRGLGRGQLQSAVPPTPGANGGTRRWNECWAIADLPEAAYAFLEHLNRSVVDKPSPPVIREPRRQSNGCPNYIETAIQRECDMVASAVEGARHNTLRNAASKLGRFVKAGLLDQAEQFDRLAEAGRRNSLPEREVRDAIDWGLSRAVPCALPSRSAQHEKVTATQTESEPQILGTNSGLLYKTNPPFLQKEHMWHYSDQKGALRQYAILDEKLIAVIRKHILRDDDLTPRKSLFCLRREIEPIANERRFKVTDWRSVVAYWWTASSEKFAGLPPYEVVWCVFQEILKVRIRERFGQTLERVKARIPRVKVPRPLVGTKLEAIARAMIAFSEVNREKGRQTFRASYQIIAELSGIKHRKTAQRWLCDLEERGFIALVKAGTPGRGHCRKQSTWEWRYSPRRGERARIANKRSKKSQTRQPATTVDAERSPRAFPVSEVPIEPQLIPLVNQPCLIDDPSDFGETEPPPRSAQTAANGQDSRIAINQPEHGGSRPALEPIDVIAPEASDGRALRMAFDDGLNRALVEHTARPQLESPP